MQTLISVFESRTAARRAVGRLLESGFDKADIHLQGSGEPAPRPMPDQNREQDLELGERVMKSAEREVAVDAEAFEAITQFFSKLFGGRDDAASYSKAVRRRQSVLVVDATGDHLAEVAAVIMHEEGAIDVDDHRPDEVPESMRSMQKIERPQQPPLSELVPDRPGTKPSQ